MFNEVLYQYQEAIEMNHRLYDTECGHCGCELWVDHFPEEGFMTVCDNCAIDYDLEEVGI
jgi:hypothetical protein